MPIINFVPNPNFTALQLEIRVGSVIRIGNKKGVVVNPGRLYVESRSHPNDVKESTDRKSTVLLPEKVVGVGPDGWQFAPLSTVPSSYSWEQYPPKAGMVVEITGIGAECDKYRVLFCGTRDGEFVTVDAYGAVAGRIFTIKDLTAVFSYLPRPDLMWERGTA